MNISAIKTSFNAGELSPYLDGRSDLDKYAQGCSTLENFIPLPEGPLAKRPGTMFINSTKNNGKVWLARFEFNLEQSFILEFGVGYIRFYYNQGQVLSGGSVYEVATPYTASDLTNEQGAFGLSLTQNGDVIYIVTNSKPPYKLSRFGNTNWTLTALMLKNGPFQDFNTDITKNIAIPFAATYMPNGASVSLVSNFNIFNANFVNTLFCLQVTNTGIIKGWIQNTAYTSSSVVTNDNKFYVATNSATSGYIAPVHEYGTYSDGGVTWQYAGEQSAYVLITSVTNATTAVGIAQNVISLPFTNLAGYTGTYSFAAQAWGTNLIYPTDVNFFRQRLVFSLNQKLWFSKAGDFENFEALTFGQVLDDNAITITVSSEESSIIQSITPTTNGLVCATSSNQIVVTEGSIGQVFSPSNVKVSATSGSGLRYIKPIKVDNVILAIARLGDRLLSIQYDANSGDIVDTNLTILSNHILKPGIVAMAYQHSPYDILWMVRSDGQLIGFTFNLNQQVTSFHRHIFDGKVESVCCIPNATTIYDDLYLVINRTINGASVRYIEILNVTDLLTTAQADGWYVDCGLSLSSATPFTSVIGLNHLIGKTVDILADGNYNNPQVVDNTGAITLSLPTYKAIVGLPITSRVATMRMEGGGNNGTAQGKVKRVSKAVLRLLRTMGQLLVAPSLNGNNHGQFNPVILKSTSGTFNNSPLLFTGDTLLEISAQYSEVGRLAIIHTQPFPCVLICLMTNWEVNDN